MSSKTGEQAHDTESRQSAEEYPDEDIIDLGALLRAVWSFRHLMLVTALAAFFGLAALLAVTKLAIPTTQVHQVALRFVFPGAAKGIYPNEQPFSPNDLLSPVVLERVYKKNRVEKYGLKLKDFVSALSIHPYSPTHDSIVARYQKRLSNRKLSFTERKRIEENMKAELREAENGNALLRLTLIKRLPVPDAIVDKILNDIPREWANYSIGTLGVLKLPVTIHGKNTLNSQQIMRIEPLLVVETLHRDLLDLIKDLTEIYETGGSRTVSDPGTGYSFRGLLADLRTFELTDIANVKARLLQNGVIENKDILLASLKEREKSLRQKADLLEQQAANAENALRLFLEKQGNQRNRLLPDSSGASQPNAPGQPTTQLTEGFIDKLVTLLTENNESVIAYKRNMANRVANLRNSSISYKITADGLASLAGQINKMASANSADPEKLAKARQALLALSKRLENYRHIASILIGRITEKKISRNGKLYDFFKLTASQSAYSSHPLVNRKMFFILLAMSFAAAIFALFAGLAWKKLLKRT